MFSNIELKLNEYYLHKLVRQVRENGDSNKRIPLILAVSSAIKEYIVNEGFNVSDLRSVSIVGNKCVVFQYYTNYYNSDHTCQVSLDIDGSNASINNITVTDKVDFLLEEDKRIGSYVKSYDNKIYTNTKHAYLKIDYDLDIGKELIGALKIDEEFKVYLSANNEILHFMSTDEDYSGKNISLKLTFSIEVTE